MYHPKNNQNHYLNKPKIGIIAGMGPKSTAPFIEKLVQYCQEILKCKFDEDFPYLHILSLPTPFRINEMIDKEITLFDLKCAIKVMENNGVSFIVIPCNTVHKHYSEYSKYTDIPILNIVKETVKIIRESSKEKEIALLATEVTIFSGIYQELLNKFKFKLVLNQQIQEVFNNLLGMIKITNVEDNIKMQAWRKLESLLISLGVKSILSACTDLSYFLEKKQVIQNLSYFDSMDILAKETVLYFENICKKNK